MPDPHPPLGGRAPGGAVVGGRELLRRTVVKAPGSAPLPTPLTATAFMVTDLDTGQVLAARDPHGRYQPASVLKLLTSITILPRLPGRRVVIASRAAADAEGSAVGLVPGGRYTVDTLFKSLLMMSGNDAAVALSDAAGGVGTTVAAMNAEAARLGAYDTLVQTPSGLDGWKQLTSAYDLTLVLRAAVRIPRLVAYDETSVAALPRQKVGARSWRGVPLFNQSQSFFDHVPGAILAKTGFTDAAQHTYVCAARRGGRRIGVVLLRAQRRPLDLWQQAAHLLDWAYRVPRASSAVGTLAGPAPANAPVTASASASAAARAGAGGIRTSAARRSTLRTHPRGIGAVVVLVGGAALLALVELRRRRRRPLPRALR